MCEKLRNKKHESSGQVLLELLLVLPVFLIIVFVGIDIIMALDKYQIALSLSKDFASTAYRECVIDMNDYSSSSTVNTSGYYFELLNPSGCINNLADSKLKASMALIDENAGFVLSAYGKTYKTGLAAVQTALTIYNAPNSRYSKEKSFPFSMMIKDQPDGNTAKVLEDYEVVIIAEVFIPHNTLFPFIMNYLNFPDGMVYGVTIY